MVTTHIYTHTHTPSGSCSNTKINYNRISILTKYSDDTSLSTVHTQQPDIKEDEVALYILLISLYITY